MNKPYGYKENDLITLARFISGGGFSGKPLSQGFREYAALSGKAAGSVRNLYYALAKFSREDAEFTAKYLNGNPITVEQSEVFSEDEKCLLEKIAELKERGCSVRKATITLAGGDAKKALRYQNKFRNTVKQSNGLNGTVKMTKTQTVTDEFLTAKLKAEINKLADRLALSLKKENSALLRQVAALKAENERLNKRFNANGGRIAEYFGRAGGAPVSEILRPENY